MQFARKNQGEQLPYFSGNKEVEIVSILDEIKELFLKYLSELKGGNKNRILDIKSTKWHDDYSVFKNGIKTLDNMYINLINFAFENVRSVEQAVEQMIAFKLLGKRETIILHSNKKIEKVNELMLSEIKACEKFAKTKPNQDTF